MATTLFGIKNCDSVKKAKKWLDAHDVLYRFHDFRADGLEPKQLQVWLKKTSPETLINRRGTSWRQLADADKQRLSEPTLGDAELTLICANPTLIKRPVLADGANLEVGFNETTYRNLFS